VIKKYKSGSRFFSIHCVRKREGRWVPTGWHIAPGAKAARELARELLS
jgi:hypothetical protein